MPSKENFQKVCVLNFEVSWNVDTRGSEKTFFIFGYNKQQLTTCWCAATLIQMIKIKIGYFDTNKSALKYDEFINTQTNKISFLATVVPVQI